MRKIGFILLCISLIIISCNTDGDGPSNMDLLTSQKWILAAAKVNPPFRHNSLLIEDIYGSPVLPDCIKDEQLAIHSDGNYEILPGADGCSSEYSQKIEGVWKFTANEDTIILNDGTDSTLFLTIIDLNEQQFKFSVVGLVNHVFNANLLSDSTSYTFVVQYDH